MRGMKDGEARHTHVQRFTGRRRSTGPQSEGAAAFRLG
jgi:hypothetical protein